MKAIRCDLCGSNEFSKEGDYFVCKHCRTQYSQEEAKKLIIEGTVTVAGIPQLEGILKNANIAFEDKNYTQANNLYTQVLSIETDNYHALLYKGISSAYIDSSDVNRIGEAVNCIKRALALPDADNADYGAFVLLCSGIIKHIESLYSISDTLLTEKKNKAIALADSQRAPAIAAANASHSAALMSAPRNSKGEIGFLVKSGIDGEHSSAVKRIEEVYSQAVNTAQQDYQTSSAKVSELKAESMNYIQTNLEERAEKARQVAKEYYANNGTELAELQSEYEQTRARIANIQQEIQQHDTNYQQFLVELGSKKDAIGLLERKKAKEIDTAFDAAADKHSAVVEPLQAEARKLETQIGAIKQKIEYGTDSLITLENGLPNIIPGRRSDQGTTVVELQPSPMMEPKKKMGKKSKRQLIIVIAIVAVVLILCCVISSAISASQNAADQQRLAEQKAVDEQAEAEKRAAEEQVEAEAEARKQQEEKEYKANVDTANAYINADARTAKTELEAKGFTVTTTSFGDKKSVDLNSNEQSWVVLSVEVPTGIAKKVTLTIDTPENIAARVAEEEAREAERVAAEAAAKAEADRKASETVSQKNAIRKAQSYLDFMAFSKTGLIEQLEYEGFSSEDATYGVEYCGADWMEQAALKAQDYLDFMSFSRQGLIEQLQYEGFSYEEAVHGVDTVGL